MDKDIEELIKENENLKKEIQKYIEEQKTYFKYPISNPPEIQLEKIREARENFAQAIQENRKIRENAFNTIVYYGILSFEYATILLTVWSATLILQLHDYGFMAWFTIIFQVVVLLIANYYRAKYKKLL